MKKTFSADEHELTKTKTRVREKSMRVRLGKNSVV